MTFLSAQLAREEGHCKFRAVYKSVSIASLMVLKKRDTPFLSESMIPLLNHSPPSTEKEEVSDVSEKIQPNDVSDLTTGPITTIRDETFHPIS